jgi:hypothetical protein
LGEWQTEGDGGNLTQQLAPGTTMLALVRFPANARFVASIDCIHTHSGHPRSRRKLIPGDN